MGKSTVWPSRSSTRTTACPVCGNNVSLKQLRKSAICIDYLSLSPPQIRPKRCATNTQRRQDEGPQRQRRPPDYHKGAIGSILIPDCHPVLSAPTRAFRQPDDGRPRHEV